MSRLPFFFLAFLPLLPLTSAALQQVMVLDLTYERGNITMENSTVKHGFYPDRRIQPESGYTLALFSEGEVLYSFTFKDPAHEIREGTDEHGDLSGGLIIHEHVRFSLIVPYYEEMDRIVIYSPSGEVAMEENLSATSLLKRGLLAFGIFIVAMLFAALLLFFRRRG
jgi:hypothetical protein